MWPSLFFLFLVVVAVGNLVAARSLFDQVGWNTHTGRIIRARTSIQCQQHLPGGTSAWIGIQSSQWTQVKTLLQPLMTPTNEGTDVTAQVWDGKDMHGAPELLCETGEWVVWDIAVDPRDPLSWTLSAKTSKDSRRFVYRAPIESKHLNRFVFAVETVCGRHKADTTYRFRDSEIIVEGETDPSWCNKDHLDSMGKVQVSIQGMGLAGSSGGGGGVRDLGQGFHNERRASGGGLHGNHRHGGMLGNNRVASMSSQGTVVCKIPSLVLHSVAEPNGDTGVACP